MPTKKQYQDSIRRKENRLALCSKCGLEKDWEQFESDPNRRPFGLSSHCNECNRKRKSRQGRIKYHLLSCEEKRKFNRIGNLKKLGCTTELYEQLLAKQNGLCAICGKSETHIHPKTKITQSLSVDHCHKSNAIRGLLCHKCNKGLGLFLDNPRILAKAISYLENNDS